MTLWDSQSNGFGQGVAWSTSDEDSYASWASPGAYISIGYASTYVYVYPGTPEGSFWLNEVVTITSSGGIQNYNLAQGAASSVAPSLFAVAVAAAFALFRL